MSFLTACHSRWLAGTLPALALTASAAGQAPEIIQYTFDSGDATNTAVPGVGNGSPNAGVSFVAGNLCGGSGTPAAQSNGASQISAGWQMDLGPSDYTIGMHLDLTVGTNAFQYYFGSSSAGGFRCFSRGVAGTNGIMLRTLTGGGDVIIAGGVSNVAPTHVCWVYDSSVPEVRGYLNGVLNNTVLQPAPSNLVSTSADFNVMTYTTTEMLAGNVMDDFRLYRRAITQGEIDLWVQCGGGPGGIGSTYCSPAIPNSTGFPGTVTATGSVFAAANSVTLTADQLTADFGYFLNSMAQGFFNPPNSNGILCLGGVIGRYTQPGLVQQGPSFSIQLDLNNTPTPNAFVAIQPGETWNFQAWYRDSGSNNFTDAVEIQFL